MIKFPVALQLYTVRDDVQADFLGTLKKVKAMGYDGVEFAGLFGHSAEEVKAMCAEADLIPISAHVPYLDLVADIEGTVKTYADIGCKYIAIPYLLDEYRPGNEKFNEVIENARKIGECCNKYGIILMYHNHDFEFVKLNGEYALDILYKEVPAELLQTEMDICWIKIVGEDPAKYLRKYAGRAPIVHLKDFAGEKTENMYALIGVDDGDQKGQPVFEFRPVGYGRQDIPTVLRACDAIGAEWIVCEQDMPSLGKTPIECANMAINYLKTL